ncbi:TolC family protein [Halarcobacter sp.]|uniref:TolC family protein n=1 Tax=Halarcobacter sp. TaxID=2321133 RepID=UPI002AA78AFC|nr:TolC family protein [Halarcobacter sp.]
MIKKILIVTFLSSLLLNILNAKEYKIRLVLDDNSSGFIKDIKEETKTLFNLEDEINYQIIKCKTTNCIDKENRIYLIKSENKNKKIKNSYIVSYNDFFSKLDKQKIVRATALSIFEFLKEKKSSSIHIENKKNKKLVLTKKDVKLLNLDDVYSNLIKNNFSIKQNYNNTLLSSLDIESAKSNYKPQVEFFSNVIQIDSDRAEYSSGQYSEGTVDMGVKLTQLIYSNSVIKNIEIKKLLDKSVENQIKASNDEILYRIVLTYLDITRAKNSIDIINTNQQFIKENLEFAKEQFDIGVADKSDVFRWESELADVSMKLTTAQNSLKLLKTELANTILINKDYILKKYDLDSEVFRIFNNDAIKVLDNSKVQNLLSEEIVLTHPNLKYIKRLIEAKKEEKSINEASRYSPKIAFEAQARKIVDRYGQAENFQRPWDDEEYQAVLNLTIPIYEGGKKSVDIQKNELELINLKLKYEETKNLINKNIKQNIDALDSSFKKLFYAKKSMKFTKKNYQSVLDKYKKGEVNIITLLDAQNTYTISRLNKNISEIEYLSNLSSIYYFTGNIDVLVDKNKKNNLEKKILKAIDEK